MAVTGGHVAPLQDPGITVGALAVWTGDGRLGDNVQNPTSAFARTQTLVAAPAATASTTAVMMGLAGSITPKSTGNVLITISGDENNSTIADGVSKQVSYGTGSAPANGAALTGTQTGSVVKYVASTAAGKGSFSITVYVTGLVVGTAYWIDLAVAAITGGSATIADVGVVAVEV